MIHIHVLAPPPHQLIGDSIAQVPFMRAVGAMRGDSVYVTGPFNRHVIPLLEGMPITFDPDATGTGADFTISAQGALGICMRSGFTLHMAQCYFRMFDQPVPDLPIDLPLCSEPCGLPPGLVISPFSFSDLGTNVKRWPHDRWVQVVQTLRRLGLADHVYVVGSSQTDGTAPYAVAGIQPVFDRPLTQVLDLMRQAPLVMTLDSGMGHLAHFGGISRHVMIYANCLPGKFAEAPRALHVRGGMPATISADQVLEAAQQVLGSSKDEKGAKS